MRLFFALCLSILSGAAFAQTNPQVDVIGGRDAAQPIAVVPFAGSGTGENDIAAIIRADLQRSGQFKAMPESAMPEKPTTAAELHLPVWQAAGQGLVLIGRVTDGASMRVEYELFDVVHKQRLLGFAKSGPASAARDIAHQIADDVYQKVLKERGAFWTRMAYVRVEGIGKRATYHLVVADSDGHNARVLETANAPIMSPAWSPDGRRIAYVSFANGNSTVKVRNLAGGDITVASFRGLNASPSFSPDGAHLAVTLSRDGNPEIYTLPSGGGAPMRVTHQLGIDTSPVWTPSGIYFTSDRGGRPQIYRTSPSGGSASRITFQGDYNADVTFSLDGKVMAVTQGNGGNYRIAVFDTRSGPGQWTTVSPGSLDESPSLAPNGSMVMYDAHEGSRNVIHVVSSDGRVRERIDTGGNAQDPAWSPYRSTQQ